MSNWDTGDWSAAAIGAVLILIGLLILWWVIRRPKATPSGGAQPVAYGLDFSWSRPTAEDILAAGYSFVCRYLSWSTTGKNLTADEALYYQSYGIQIVSNWEYYADAARNGYPQGVEDAKEAMRQHLDCGGSPNDPIYFSVDYDAQVPEEYGPVREYFKGIISVIGLHRTGGYGSYQIIRQLFNDGLITFGWQTYAWSYGAWDGRAQLRQVKNGIYVGGAEVDRNEAWNENYGAWFQNEAPPITKGDGAVLLNCPFDTERQDLFYIGANNEVFHAWWTGGMTAMWNGQNLGMENLGGRLAVGTLTAMWTPDGESLYIAGLGSANQNAPAGTGQYWGMTLDRYGNRSGWGSMEQVYGAMPGTSTQPPAERTSDRKAFRIMALLFLLLLASWIALAVYEFK